MTKCVTILNAFESLLLHYKKAPYSHAHAKVLQIAILFVCLSKNNLWNKEHKSSKRFLHIMMFDTTTVQKFKMAEVSSVIIRKNGYQILVLHQIWPQKQVVQKKSMMICPTLIWEKDILVGSNLLQCI